MRTILLQFLIGLFAVIGTAIWADRLLYVGKRGVETVLTVDELEQLVRKDKENDTGQEQEGNQESGEQKKAAENPAAEPVDPTVEETEEETATVAAKADNPQTVASLPAAEADAASEVPDETTPPKTNTTPADAPPQQAALDDGVDRAVAPLADPVALGSSDEEGGLASLQGGAGLGEPKAAANAGGQVGLVCNVRFSSRPQWAMLGRVPGVMPAAIRSRPEYKEVARLDNGRVSAPQPLRDFVESHQEFAGCWTVLLPKEWLLDVADQLLAYKGGWQAHLLVDDETFRRWMDDAARFASAQGHQVQDVARLEATARVEYAQGDYEIVLTFRELALKESEE